MRPDAFTLWLTAHRPELPVVPYQPGARFGAPQRGWELHIGRTKFVYRIPPEQPDVFYIVLIERGAGPRSLHSPLADLVRLLLLVKGSQTGVRWIRGHVDADTDEAADALAGERLLAFYRRYLTTVEDGVENGVQWYGGDLTTFSWAHEKRKIRSLARDDHRRGAMPITRKGDSSPIAGGTS
jgi:hypothetical protein